ncbi:5499_t:CDS:1, partial [Funneliformis caledonium]
MQDSNSTNDSMKRLFSIIKVNNTQICNSSIEASYYSSELYKEALCFNCGVVYEEHINYDEYFPYCEECNKL